MIDILKRKLLIRYSLILFSVSLLIFWGGYAAYRIISKNVIASSLYDYLQEEVFEFKNLVNLDSYVHYFYEETVSFLELFDKDRTCVFIDN